MQFVINPFTGLLDATGTGGSGGTAFTAIAFQKFETAGSFTYTPSANMKYAIIQMIGAGGAGGGSGTQTTTAGGGGGGGAGGYLMKIVTAAQVGASQAVVIGAGGIWAGANASSTTMTGLGLSITGAATALAATAGIPGIGGTGGVATGGDINYQGSPGTSGSCDPTAAATYAISGTGGRSFFGDGALCVKVTAGIGTVGNNASANGGGGSGGAAASTSAKAGGTGGAGAIYITEFC